jgi:hypothetical protein
MAQATAQRVSPKNTYFNFGASAPARQYFIAKLSSRIWSFGTAILIAASDVVIAYSV